MALFANSFFRYLYSSSNGETSHESRIESLGFRSNVITTSTKNSKVNAKSSDLIDATLKIWVNESVTNGIRDFNLCVNQ